MIARYFILLPFDLFVIENDDWPNWPVVEGSSPDFHFRVLPPFLIAERPKPTGSVLAQGVGKLSPPSFTDNVLVNGRKIAAVNVLTVDLIKPEFERSVDAPLDPSPELAFEIANETLARVRVYARAFQIKPLVINSDPWQLAYLRDDLNELDREEGKRRGQLSSSTTIGVAAITPEIIQMIAANRRTAEPYVWDHLLLDAQEQLPDVGSSIVMAYAALETFVAWALEILHETRPLPDGLWQWIKKRDHWSKEPSVREQFDTLLTVFTGHSLKKEEPSLWGSFGEIRKARNTIAHEGVAITAGKAVHAAKAMELVDNASKIIAWVEQLLPEPHRRLRTHAIGPFARRLVTPEEGNALGLAHIVSGRLGPLASGESIRFGFESKSDEQTPKVDDKAADLPSPPLE